MGQLDKWAMPLGGEGATEEKANQALFCYASSLGFFLLRQMVGGF